MANTFYNPSGNPGTGSEGLSATMRAEFAAIGVAFDIMPRISTTGLFDTVFNQVGSYTFTLPSGPGTLATTANVATETARATAAEGVLTAAVATEATTRAAADTAETNRALAAEALLAPKASPTFTGAPLTPTAAPGTNTTQIATTAFSVAAIAVETARATASEAAIATLVSHNVGRNLFHNGLDRIQQRGSGPFTTSSYVSDRWKFDVGTGGGTRSVSIATLSDAARAAIGDEEATFGLQYVVAGGSAAGDFDVLHQNMENVRRTAGKSVTISFWAIAGSGSPKIGVAPVQNFGAGGSPSASVLIAAQTVTLSTTWTRYNLTFAIPSISGKTLGTTVGTDNLEIDFWMSSGSSNNAQAGSIGVQSATMTLFGRQLEIGSTVTPLEKPDIRYDLANCQRFYTTGSVGALGYASTVIAYGNTNPFPVRMRSAPSISVGSLTISVNVSGTANVDIVTVDNFRFYFISAGAGATQGQAPFTASADL